MKLFIANVTKQNQHFHYRVLDNNKLLNQHIEMGKQVQIYGELQPEDVDYIISQHEMYGMVKASEVKSTKEFIGLCYSIDTPVKLDQMHLAFEHNDYVLDERGKEIRKIAAIAIDDSIKNMDLGSEKTKTIITEQPSPDNKDLIAEGIEVVRGQPTRRRKK